MSFRYSSFGIQARKAYRRLLPVPRSPYTIGHIDDICVVNLVPPERLQEFFERGARTLQQRRGQEIGDYLEFGVFNGSSLSSMYLVAKKLRLSMRFFGFDAFAGLPAGSEKEDDGVWKKGFYACSFEQMKECLRRKDIDVKSITWVKGWYQDTLTAQTLKKYAIGNPGVIFIDCDTYSSSKQVLDFIGPLITKPVLICLDDWKLNDLDIKEMGEYKSFNEFLDNNPQLRAIPIKSYNRKSRSFIVEPKDWAAP